MDLTGRGKVAVICAVVVLGAAVFALLGFALVSAFNPYNPMQLAFLASFEMYNASGTEVWVTPIGMHEGSGKYSPLERFSGPETPALPSRNAHDIHIGPGETVVYTYDWDDINFRHILVKDTGGNVFVVDTDTMGSLDSCYGPQQQRYIIPRLSLARRAPAELVPCTKGRTVRWRVLEYE